MTDTLGERLLVRHEKAAEAIISGQLAQYLLHVRRGALVEATLAVLLGAHTGGAITEASARAYSMEYEAEADYMGLYIAARAGFAIENAPPLWRRLAAISLRAVKEGRTHPTTPARFVALRATIEEIEAKRAAGLPLLPERRTAPQPVAPDTK